MNKKLSKVCVYCASSAQVDQKYFDAVDRLSHDLVKHHIHVVFGGGAVGLMGRLADKVLEYGGKITGIMPHFMRDVEWAHKEVSTFHFTEDMHERKKRFLEGADALIALPGGCGTLEELLEAITLKRLGLYLNPIIILNTEGFYDPLKKMLARCIEEKFMNPQHAEMWTFVDEPEKVIPAIMDAPGWDKSAINFAAVKNN